MKNNYIRKVLSNGVEVYFYKDKNCKRTFVSYSVNYGSFGYFNKFCYDGKKYHVNPGIAHFLEHTLIEHSKYGNMMHVFMDKNYDVNGVTYPEVTSYYFLGIKDIEESIEQLINMVDNPVFTKEDVEEVKSAVIEELKKNSDDKYRKAFACNRRNVFANFDACGENFNVLGTAKSTSEITYDEVMTCYNAYYHNKNKFLVIGGNIDINYLVDLLEKIFKTVPSHENKMDEYPYPDNFNVRTTSQTLELVTDTDFLIHTFKMKKPKNISNIKLDLAMTLYAKMKFSSSNKKIEQMELEKIAIGGIGYYIDVFKDTMCISFYTDTCNSNEFLKRLMEMLNTDELDENDFVLAKRFLVVSELKKKDYIYSAFKSFPTSKEFSTNIDEIDTINSMKLEDVKRFFAMLNFDYSTTTIVKNKTN